MLAQARSAVQTGDYLRRHLPICVMTMLIFLMGIIFGSLAVKVLPQSQKAELAEDLRVFFRGFGGIRQAAGVAASRQALYNNLKTILIAWVLGLSVIGAPGILVLLFLRGFIIGFTVGFLVDEMAARGIILAAVSVLPQNVFIIPAILGGCAASLAFAVALAQDRLTHKRVPVYPQFLLTVVISAGAALLLVLAGAVESYVTPVFIQLASKYLL